MKSKVLLLVACFLILTAAALFAQGAVEMKRTGTILSFTGTSVKLGYVNQAGDQSVTNLVIDGRTVVKRLDQNMAWLDVARKGLTVTAVSEGVFANSIQLPFYGLEAQGYGSATPDKNIYSLSDVRVNVTDSNLTAVSERKDAAGRLVSKIEVSNMEPSLDNAWALNKSNELMLGNIDVIEGSVRVKLDGMLLNVAYGTDGKGTFYEPVGTSCVVDSTKGIATIKFDANLGKDYSEVAPRLDLSFKKKMYEQKTTEITYLELAPSCVIEVNGEPAGIIDALNLANFWLIRCNAANQLVHIDAYFVNRFATVMGVSGNMLVIDTGMPVVLELSDGATILTPTGAGKISDLVPGAMVLVTTEPADAYRAVLVSVTN